MSMRSCLFRLFLGVNLFIAAASVANADLKPELPTMGANGRVYYITSKSGLADSNDTGLMTSYSLNVYAGSNKTVSVQLEGNQAEVSYGRNNAKLSQSALSCALTFYLGFFYIGAFGGSVQHSITRSDSNKLEIFATQYGGASGILVSLSKGSYFGAEIRGGTYSDLREAAQQDVKMGLKVDSQIYMNYDITKNFLDLQAGFHYSSQSARFEGAGNGEILSAPFLGLSLNTDF